MHVRDAILSRRSVRAFLNHPVPKALLVQVLSDASRAPSGGNLQPWHITVLTGEALEAFRAHMTARLRDPSPDPPEYDIYPSKLHEPYRSRRYRIGDAMYATLGIPRERRDMRLEWFAQNYAFFGAPVGLLCAIDRRLGTPQWSDLGMYLQNVMLLLREHGLHSCPQEAWSLYGPTIAQYLRYPPELMLFCGMAIGYANPAEPVNGLISERAAITEFATFLGENAV